MSGDLESLPAFSTFSPKYMSSSAEFATYQNYVRSLRFEEKPDYAYLRQLIRNLFHRQVNRIILFCRLPMFQGPLQRKLSQMKLIQITRENTDTSCSVQTALLFIKHSKKPHPSKNMIYLNRLAEPQYLDACFAYQSYFILRDSPTTMSLTGTQRKM